MHGIRPSTHLREEVGFLNLASPMATTFLMGGNTMNIVRRDPWSLFAEMQNQLDRAFAQQAESSDADSVAHWRPAVDIEETETSFVLKADIPGVSPEDIELTMDGGVLAIKGERRSEKSEENNGFSRTERRFGRFERRFSLPDTADVENIEARGNDGVLAIVIPKKPVAQARKIEVTRH